MPDDTQINKTTVKSKCTIVCYCKDQNGKDGDAGQAFHDEYLERGISCTHSYSHGVIKSCFASICTFLKFSLGQSASRIPAGCILLKFVWNVHLTKHSWSPTIYWSTELTSSLRSNLFRFGKLEENLICEEQNRIFEFEMQ